MKVRSQTHNRHSDQHVDRARSQCKDLTALRAVVRSGIPAMEV